MKPLKGLNTIRFMLDYGSHKQNEWNQYKSNMTIIIFWKRIKLHKTNSQEIGYKVHLH